jgi:cytochrome c553
MLRSVVAAALAGLLGAAALATQPSDKARAEEIVSGKCFICHGMEGETSSPVFPRLAGQHARYVERQLADYKSGKRVSPVMKPMVEDLTAADFKALGAWFEAQPAKKHAGADAELTQAGRLLYTRGNPDAGIAACSACHGPQGHGTETLPRLAGQHAQYTENQLKAFNKRERTNDNAVMHAIVSKLSERDMKAVAAYLSALD